MKNIEILAAWRTILTGRKPSLSIEITRECPLRCPGCYAYGDTHLGSAGVTLRQLSDFKGDDLVRGVLDLVDQHQPLHISIVGGDPLVRYRELQVLLPLLDRRGIYVQLVTSAFREIPLDLKLLSRLNVVVSIDGLQPEHDLRRKPATYERILKTIAGRRVSVHCTITGQMMKRPGYLRDFLVFWTPRDEIKRVWFSMFTPQVGDAAPEILTREERRLAVAELLRLRPEFPKLHMSEAMIREFLAPPASPRECIFAQTTTPLSADLKTVITPCQFGGNPDCSQCGCAASLGLAAVGHSRVLGMIPIGALFNASDRIGRAVASLRNAPPRNHDADKDKEAGAAAVSGGHDHDPRPLAADLHPDAEPQDVAGAR
ncbi:MAG TPA: radical SAM protein [Candidatus Angelobacter sp.]